MSKIKTREVVKSVKTLDKPKIVGERMKKALIHTKDQTANLMDDGQATPCEYAEDKVQYVAEDIARDTAHATGSGVKAAGRKGKEALQQHRAKTAEKKIGEQVARREPQPNGPEQRPRPPQKSTTPQRSRSSPKGILPQRQSKLLEPSEGPSISTPNPVEQGRERVKRQAVKRADTARQAKKQEQAARRQMEKFTRRAADKVKEPVHKAHQTVKTTCRANRAIKQTAKSTGKASVKTAKRTVKTAEKAAKGAVKTAERTSKAAIKTAEHTAKATQRAAQAAAKAAKVAAQAARATAKAAAAAAKATAKVTVATVKAIILAVKALIAAIAAGGWVVLLVVIVICLIGLIVASCFGIFFSGEDSGTGQTMQTAVQEINQDYENKLEETKDSHPHDILEMSGSRAVWPEVLAIYAVKTTTDPDNPQEVATMDDSKKSLLTEIFWAMNEISSYTTSTSHTSTSMVSDGNGNMVERTTTVTTITLHITVSHKTADEMADSYNFSADQKKQLAELLAEENREMWSNVLYGIGVGDGEIATVAFSQLGNSGGQPYWSWYGFGSRVEWCACFVSWCANECGYIDIGVIPKFAGCGIGSQWFKDRGLWQDNSYMPRPGDIIFFDWDNKGSSGPQDGAPDHVGIVERIDGNTVYTVEGNSGDSVREKYYTIGHYEIYGYGTPAY